MLKKYLSIITNFGCHYSCPYCIVKHNDIQVPETTIQGLDNLKQTIIGYGCNIVSVSGGGDPLHHYEENKEWYQKLFSLLESMGIPLEVHTSYVSNNFPTDECIRVVYHLRDANQLPYVQRKGKEIIRVVFVVDETKTAESIQNIASYVNAHQNIDELSFRQMVDDNYETKYYHHNLLLEGHKKDWYYIQQNDYNLYYAENKIYRNYSDFQNRKENK